MVATSMLQDGVLYQRGTGRLPKNTLCDRIQEDSAVRGIDGMEFALFIHNVWFTRVEVKADADTY